MVATAQRVDRSDPRHGRRRPGTGARHRDSPTQSGPAIASRSRIGAAPRSSSPTAHRCGWPAARPCGFDGSGRLALLRGTMYVDADPARRAGAIVVDTPFGRVRHVGTQFELRLQPSSLDVRVREGEVAVDGRGATADVTRGRSRSVISRDRPPERGRSTRPGRNGRGSRRSPSRLRSRVRPSSAFLQWVSREQGWQWAYADDGDQAPGRARRAAWIDRGAIARRGASRGVASLWLDFETRRRSPDRGVDVNRAGLAS